MPPPVYPAGSYPARVVSDGASNYWRLNESSGLSAVDVIGAANGTISGGVTLNQAGALADGDKAMAFNGTTTGNVIVPNGPFNIGTGKITIESWWKTLSSGDNWVLDARGNASNIGIGVRLLTNTVVFMANGIVSATPAAIGTRVVNNGQWHHIVAVVDRSPDVARIYVDGTLDVEAALPTQGWNLTPAADKAFYIGNFQFGAGMVGSLDDVAIYPRALTAPEIAAHYALRTFSLTAWRGVPWWVQIQGDDALESFNLWEPITPSNTVNLPRGVTGGIWVGGGGDVAAVMGDGSMPVVIAAVPAGSWLPLAARRINATATTATNLVALYEA